MNYSILDGNRTQKVYYTTLVETHTTIFHIWGLQPSEFTNIEQLNKFQNILNVDANEGCKYQPVIVSEKKIQKVLPRPDKV